MKPTYITVTGMFCDAGGSSQGAFSAGAAGTQGGHKPMIALVTGWILWLRQWSERRRLRRFAHDLDRWVGEMGIEDEHVRPRFVRYDILPAPGVRVVKE